MTLVELRSLAKENNIKNISKLKKEELIEMLKQVLKTNIQLENNEELDPSNILTEEKAINQTQYDANGEPIIDYKLTNEGDQIVEGILDILPDGYGFLRGDNYLSTTKDVYISMIQIKRFKLDTGDIVKGIS